jgi:hypothetical protein
VKDREELLSKARRDAGAIVEQARAEQLRMAEREAIVQRAIGEAERIRSEAADEARRMKLESEDYVDAKLAQFETALQQVTEKLLATNDSVSRTIDQVQAGREKLRGVAPATNAEIGPGAFPEGEGCAIDVCVPRHPGPRRWSVSGPIAGPRSSSVRRTRRSRRPRSRAS